MKYVINSGLFSINTVIQIKKLLYCLMVSCVTKRAYATVNMCHVGDSTIKGKQTETGLKYREME